MASAITLDSCCISSPGNDDGTEWFQTMCNFSVVPDDRDDQVEYQQNDQHQTNNEQSLQNKESLQQQQQNIVEKDVRDIDSQTQQQQKVTTSNTINVGNIKDKTSSEFIIDLSTSTETAKSTDKRYDSHNKELKTTNSSDDDDDDDDADDDDVDDESEIETKISNNNEELSSVNNNNNSSRNHNHAENNNDDRSIAEYSVISDCSLRSLHSALNKYVITADDNDPNGSNRLEKFEKNPIFGYITNTYSYRTTFNYLIPLLEENKNIDEGSITTTTSTNNDKQHQEKLLNRKKKSIEIKDHKEALALTASCRGRNHRLVADKLTSIGNCYNEMKEYDLALKSYLEALNIYSVKIGDDQPESIHCRMNIGKMQLHRGELEDALEAYSHALYMKNALGCSDVYIGEIHEVLSFVHFKRSENTEALKDLKRALRTYRDLFGDDDTKVIHTVVSIGTLYVASGDMRKAMTIYREAIKLKIGLVGKVHEEVADILIKWGLCCTKIGNIKMAMKILKRAYSMYVDRLGETHESTINALSHIGNTYVLDGEEEKALKAHSRAIRICKKVDKSSHYIMANSLVNLGILWMVKGVSGKTIRCFNEALLIYKKYFGSDHFSVSDTLYHLGTVYELTNNHEKALKYYTRVLHMRIASLGTERHIEIATTLRKIATIQSKTNVNKKTSNDYKSSLNNYGKCLDILSQTIGQTQVFADVLMEASSILTLLGETHKAKSGFKEAIRIYKLNKVDFEHASVIHAMECIKTLKNNYNQSHNGRSDSKYNVIAEEEEQDTLLQQQQQDKISGKSTERIQHHFGK